jgi:hypothetical protein
MARRKHRKEVIAIFWFISVFGLLGYASFRWALTDHSHSISHGRALLQQEQDEDRPVGFDFTVCNVTYFDNQW